MLFAMSFLIHMIQPFSLRASFNRALVAIGVYGSRRKRGCTNRPKFYLNFVSKRHCRREDQGEETPEFLTLFDNNIHVEMGGTASGFYQVEEEEHIDRLYVTIPIFCTGTPYALFLLEL
jgi:hypothetical protein